MLESKINADFVFAMKSGDINVKNTLRLVKSKLTEAQKANQNQLLSDNQVIDVLNKMTKERQKSIEAYQLANRQDLVDKEQVEIDIIQKYLPTQLSDIEVKTILQKLVKDNNFTSAKDMGNLMKIFKENYAGQADGKVVSQYAKKLL